MKKKNKNNIAIPGITNFESQIIMSVIIAVVCTILFAVMFMQFKTIEETDITAIENMRETELRTAISEWKGKYEQTQEQLDANRKSINEYKEKMEKNEATSELISQDLTESNMLLGKTDVVGEGVVLTLTNTDECPITYSHLLELVNELRYAGAEAISINDSRIIMTEIAEPENRMLVGGQRVTSPYVVKAIGNQTYLSSTLSLKDSGFIDRYQASGMKINLETSKSVKILKYNGEMKIKYMKEVETQS